MAVDRFLGGRGELPPDRGWAAPCKPDELLAARPRHRVETLPLFERLDGFSQVELVYSRDQDSREGHRCLRCDLERPAGD
jgi:hypothetical protein